jgi:hypothetical protein
MGIAAVADRFELKSAGEPDDLYYYMGDSWLAFWGLSMGLAIVAAWIRRLVVPDETSFLGRQDTR